MANENSDLAQCLRETRAALMAGDLTRLADLAPRLEAALATYRPASAAAAGNLLSDARENGRLLQAALRGVRAAKTRASELTDKGRFSTYDSRGQRNQPGLGTQMAARRL